MSRSPSVHRVVTGRDEDGRAVIACDGAAAAIEIRALPGTVFHELWATPSVPAPIDNGPDSTGPGDVVVQRGTKHAWSNRTEETARMAFVLVDGTFARSGVSADAGEPRK